jgi:DNA-binding MarR family transcriptional regulator
MPSPQSIGAVRSIARASRIIERSSADLSLADYRVLSAVVEGEARASRLAARLAVGKPTISATVDSLCRRGLLAKSQVAGDARASELALTEHGTAIFEHAETAMAERFEELCALAPDPSAVLAALATLGDAIEAVMAKRAARV